MPLGILIRLTLRLESSIEGTTLALLGLVGKMYSKIHFS